jgi:hypothetical protein
MRASNIWWTQPAQTSSQIDIEIKVFELRTDQMDSEESLTADSLLDGKDSKEDEQSEGDFFAMLRQVSRRSKPSASLATFSARVSYRGEKGHATASQAQR